MYCNVRFYQTNAICNMKLRFSPGPFISICILFFTLVLCPNFSKAQSTPVDENQLGGWYMYFWSLDLKENRFGFQGDLQWRNWNIAGDLEQLLLRGGITYRPKETNIKFTLGYAHIISGEFGDGNRTLSENRIYQEALLPQKVGGRTFILHRFRYEQRWVENQDFRTRVRYNIIINVPFNKKALTKGAVYYSFYNEIFINGQKDIGDGRMVEYFDRNRFYNAIGYAISDKLRTQLGYMVQTDDRISKGQVQVSFHSSF